MVDATVSGGTGAREPAAGAGSEGLGPLATDLATDVATDLATASLALARRYAAGATMWCTAPSWPAHAHHVAVEFVHPVIVGKRALPAAALPGDDLVGSLRVLSRPGDILVAVAGSGERAVAAAMRRARAWDLLTIWIGAGPPP
ncbi:MAG: hydrogenase assembly protein HupF, partial [Acidimicrobiales bacterium]